MSKEHPSKPIFVPAYGPHWGSHLPILAKVLQISNGPVMECGVGIFSTPFIHEYCDMEKRFVDSYEDNVDWFNNHDIWRTPLHHISLVKKWDDIPIEKRHWGVIFIDHIDKRRNIDAIRAAQHADYVVLHDSNGRYEFIYHYENVYPHYKYRHIFNAIYPHTTVLSNFKNLENL
jgi:hypothetical protein